MRERRLDTDETQIRLAADRCDQRRTTAFIGHVQDLGLGQVLEQLGGDMQISADTGRGIIELARLLLRQRDELGHRFRRHRGMHHQHKRRRRQQGNRCEILDRVERHFFIKARIHHERQRIQQQRMTIGRGPCGDLRTNVARGTRPVVNHELLPQRLAHTIEHHAPQRIHAPARRVGQDDADDVVGVGLGGDIKGTKKQTASGKQFVRHFHWHVEALLMRSLHHEP